MRFLCLLSFTLLLSLNGMSQCNPIPTNGEIYNFAVGDTLQYSISSNSGYSAYYYHVIESRNNYGTDSIVYGIQSITLPFGGQLSQSHYDQRIYHPDSATWQQPQTGWITDTLTCFTDTGLLFHHVDSHGWVTVYCSGIGEDISANGSSTDYYSQGLGKTYSYSCSNTEPCNSCSIVRLVYAHKSNGFVYGNAYSFPSGINDFKQLDAFVEVYPNAVSQNFQLRLHGNLGQNLRFVLYDLCGQRLQQELISEPVTNFYRGQLAGGLYLWQIEGGQEVVRKGKLIFE
jgi:hypothetical protein